MSAGLGSVPGLPVRNPRVFRPRRRPRSRCSHAPGRTMDLKEQDILGPDIGRHWYYVSKGRALRALLGRAKVPEVLDVGAGSGVFARQLLAAGVCDRAVCVDPNYVEERI